MRHRVDFDVSTTDVSNDCGISPNQVTVWLPGLFLFKKHQPNESRKYYGKVGTIVMAKKNDFDNEFEEDLTKDDLQIDRVDKTYLLLDNFWKTIEENLPRNRSTLVRFIATYRNKNIKLLETPYILDYPRWVPPCINILYQCTGIDQDDFVEAVLTIRGYEGYEDPYLKDKAQYILALLIMRWFIMHDYKNERVIMEHYIGYSHYWAVFLRYFPKYRPNPDVMRYTIDEMSYKSNLKRLGSVDKWLQDGVANTLESYTDRLMRASDFELHYINEKIRSKFSNAMQSIYRAQEKNEKEKKRIFISENEVDGNLVENTYGVSEVLSLATGYTTKFFADPITEKALKGALIPGGVTERDLRNVILMISDDKSNLSDVNKLFQSLFYIFLENEKYTVRDIGSLRFYNEMEKMYKPGNTSDPNRMYIKEILDKWLSMGSATFRSTNRTAMITTSRKSIYNYFVLKIMLDK